MDWPAGTPVRPKYGRTGLGSSLCCASDMPWILLPVLLGELVS